MATVPMDAAKVARCRALAGEISADVQAYIDRHTTVGVERTVARALGVEGVDDQGTPLANLLVDRIHQAGLLGQGVAFFLGRETPVPSLRPHLSSWQQRLYAFMTRNAVATPDYFLIPSARVVELGTRVEM